MAEPLYHHVKTPLWSLHVFHYIFDQKMLISLNQKNSRQIFFFGLRTNKGNSRVYTSFLPSPRRSITICPRSVMHPHLRSHCLSSHHPYSSDPSMNFPSHHLPVSLPLPFSPPARDLSLGKAAAGARHPASGRRWIFIFPDTAHVIGILA